MNTVTVSKDENTTDIVIKMPREAFGEFLKDILS